MKYLRLNNKKNDVATMTQLQLTFSLCKDCGACCFNCDYLDSQSGCTDDSYRLNTRCVSFPVLYGKPNLLGHKNVYGQILNNKEIEQKIWFLMDFEKCIIQQKELLFNNLRWILEDINNGRNIESFSVSFEDISLVINLN